ncbi:hypothetical protein B0J14DRAFT_684620 [Halenospora varia]|nr:hypothetical protein B0J14DRAFT_684620 [Halenospora varia]
MYCSTRLANSNIPCFLLANCFHRLTMATLVPVPGEENSNSWLRQRTPHFHILVFEPPSKVPAEVPEPATRKLFWSHREIMSLNGLFQSESEVNTIFQVSETFDGILNGASDPMSPVAPTKDQGALVACPQRRLNFQRCPRTSLYMTKTPEDGFYEVEKSITEHLNGDEQDHRFAFSDTGYILLVPAGTKVDDLVCHFKSCNVIAIIREHTSREKSGGIVMGRAGRYHIPGRLEDEEVNPLTPDFPVELTPPT